MMHSRAIGQKVRNFRKDRGISQLELETLINTSPGSISKIEKGKTEPTKETIFKITEVLQLNKFEIDYLIGITSDPASDQEIEDVRSRFSGYFSKSGVLAYLIDERSRILYYSKDFPRLLQTSENPQNPILGRTLPRVMLDPKFGIYSRIDTNEFEDTIYRTLARYYYMTSFMLEDKSFKDSLNAINKNKVSKKVWRELSKDPPKNVNTMESRKVKFKVGNSIFEMIYSSEVVSNNPRFEIVEYTPTNFVVKLLSKIV